MENQGVKFWKYHFEGKLERLNVWSTHFEKEEHAGGSTYFKNLQALQAEKGFEVKLLCLALVYRNIEWPQLKWLLTFFLTKIHHFSK